MSIDLATPEMQQDPYPGYAAMRSQKTPILVQHNLSGSNIYAIARYHDVVRVLKEPVFINDARKLPNWDDWTKKWYIPSALKSFIHSMALADEPDHTRLRQLVHKAFTPAMIQKLSDNIEERAHTLLDAAAGKPVIDFVADFALPLPLNIIADMMGVAEADRRKFRRWMSNTVADINPKDRLSLVPKMLNAMGLDSFLKRLIAERRSHPRDDLTTALVEAEEAGDKFSQEELIAMLFLILFAGHETTVNLLASGTLALLQHPDQFQKLKANPQLMDSAIEELLRYTNPVQHIATRYNLEAVEIGGVMIPQYSSLQLLIAAANRDETVFENPDALDITRSPNRHIALGFGVHYCLGAPLARLEAQIAFNILFKRFPDLQLAVPADCLQWRGAPSLRGLVRLPIRLNG